MSLLPTGMRLWLRLLDVQRGLRMLDVWRNWRRHVVELTVSCGRNAGKLLFWSGGLGGETSFGRAVDTGELQHAVED